MNRRSAIFSLMLFGSAFVCFFLFRLRPKRSFNDVSDLPKYQSLIIELSETILPETADSPGAKQALVYLYIFNSIKHCTAPTEQRIFLKGLEQMEEHSLRRYGVPFEMCSLKQRTILLADFERTFKMFNGILGKIRKRVFGPTFFEIIKQLTTEGYCSSMIGATKGLRYDVLPGSYSPCINLGPNQRAWATV